VKRLPHRYEIALARPGDLPHIAPIELAAARLLAGHAPESALKEVTPDDHLRAAQADGRLWVALSNDVPVGFALVELVEPDAAHLEEIDVHPDHGRQGLGTRLVRLVCEWAEARGSAVTLTTFRDVPWNMPFYTRLGFEEITPRALTPALREVLEAEVRRGFDPGRRVAMRWRSPAGMSRVRRAKPADHEAIVVLWERSVRATHHFLTERDVEALRPLVADELMSDRIDWWVLESATDLLLGFLGFANDSIEGLFIDPNHRGQGAGSALVAHAQRLALSSLAVDVNEQNDDAVGFYASLGFSVVGRSPTDGGGRPFPLLHMIRGVPRGWRRPVLFAPLHFRRGTSMARYLMLIRHREDFRNAQIPQALLDEMGAFVNEKQKAGVLIDTAGLQPTSNAATVRLSNGKVSLTDGPFSEAKEVIGGYALINAHSRAKAIEIATEFVELHRRTWPEFECACELRPIEGGESE